MAASLHGPGHAQPPRRGLLRRLGMGLGLGLGWGLGLGETALAGTPAASAAEDFSPAERALFMTNHLARLKPPLGLRYRFTRSGSLEEPFEDTVRIRLSARPNRQCCAAEAEFLTGERRIALPSVEQAEGNPVLLYFLERDISEMGRLTKGKPNYFRKRIRMAIYQGAQLQTVSLDDRGRTVSGQEITISPYLDDPMRARFEKFARKQYVFTLSPTVPGGIHAIRTRIEGETPEAPPLIAEAMVFTGSESLPRKP